MRTGTSPPYVGSRMRHLLSPPTRAAPRNHEREALPGKTRDLSATAYTCRENKSFGKILRQCTQRSSGSSANRQLRPNINNLKKIQETKTGENLKVPEGRDTVCFASAVPENRPWPRDKQITSSPAVTIYKGPRHVLSMRLSVSKRQKRQFS
ncbi:hypothetical protein EVAR_51232_1 [Eumeta japonica]|uniref:Uncharacterized protein n=1 Tax=Eumeta variegata TaxID=151549 RepID=A0A4C1X5A7_EUMVA|nr:hypothetical protein EVAR_51232_1 [Eumeta japonica]